ncbi:hypothetical protein GOBAR_AA12638 [Gossypium barbadense]|uniref:BRI1 kinase inhibitor 1 n=1 Tax=Gossypium barbadense TaxID=3634 RepID=A0A2P5XXE2_GOSBA|nr:hypothetical protein GOBAR_AA12638 [Gossypium barbadense]
MDAYQQPEERKVKEEIREGSSILSSPVSTPSTSPSHEFSFTVSLHSSSNYKTKTPSSIAVDLSPADDLFFHGHLLPLHLLSHFPVSPRSSTNSLDGFNVPPQDLPRRQRGVREKEDKEKHGKKKMRLDLSNALKRYMRMIRPLLFFTGKREKKLHHHTQAYSFSGNLSLRNKKSELRGRKRDYYSAPASMRTSPTNSGLLVATTGSTSDSTMEELQAAIQSAIAHCKNSFKGG